MYAYVALFFVVLTYGMETAFFRFSQDVEVKKVYGTSILSLLFTSGSFILLVTLFSGWIAGSLGYPNHSEYVIWFSIVIGLDAFTAIPFARLRQENRPVRFAFLKLISISSNVILNLFFILLCPYLLHHYDGSGIIGKVVRIIYNPEIGVGYVFIANLISSILTLVLLIPYLRDARWKFDRQLWNKMIAYALPLLVMGLAGTINESFDRILLKHLLPDKASAMYQLGIYGACYKISILMTLFIQTFRFAAEPFFFNEFKNQNAKITYARVMNYFVIVCSVIFLGVMSYLDIVKHFVGKEYYAGLKVVPVLLMANLFLGIFYNLSIWYKLTNKTLLGAYVSLFGAFLSLVLNYFTIPLIGYMGSAWTHFACYGSMMVISYILGQKYYPIRYNLRKIFTYLGYSVLLYVLNMLTRTSSIHINLLLGTFYLALFVVPVYLIEKRILIRQRV
jgi:O-antigen/teichoic acid export membrane protein